LGAAQNELPLPPKATERCQHSITFYLSVNLERTLALKKGGFAYETAMKRRRTEKGLFSNIILIMQNDMSRNTKGHRTKGTGQNEWFTPDKYIQAAREVMGDIDLDPATSKSAPASPGFLF